MPLRTDALMSLIEKLEFISYAPHGFKDPLVGNTLKLFTKTLYMNVNSSRVSEIIKAPDLIEKLIASKDMIIV